MTAASTDRGVDGASLPRVPGGSPPDRPAPPAPASSLGAVREEELTLTEAKAWWREAFGDVAVYFTLTDDDLIGNVNSRGEDFARAVRVIEASRPWPSSDVMHAVGIRLRALREEQT